MLRQSQILSPSIYKPEKKQPIKTVHFKMFAFSFSPCRFSVTKRGSDFSGTFVFTVDDDAYAAMLTFSDNDSAPSASATINLELSAGQVVRVENVDSTIIFGTEFGLVYTWFSGHLLYPLWKMLTLKLRSFDIGIDKIFDILLFNKVSHAQAQTFLVFFLHWNQRIRIHIINMST